MTADRMTMHKPTHILYQAHNHRLYTCAFTPEKAKQLHSDGCHIWIKYLDDTGEMLTLAYLDGWNIYARPLLCLDEVSRHSPFLDCLQSVHHNKE